MSKERTIIAARPGWYVAVFVPREDTNDGADQFDLTPIVAWEIERWASSKKDDFCRTATPICTENYFNDNSALNDGWMLRDPSGCYHDPDGSKFDTVDEALAHLQARRRRHVPAA